jgi:signal transduction histidine kinase
MRRPDPRRYWARWRPARVRPRNRYTVRARMALLYGVVSALVGIAPVGLTCVLIQQDVGSTVLYALDQSGIAVTVRQGTPVPAIPAQRTEPESAGRTEPLNTKDFVAANRLVVVVPCKADPGSTPAETKLLPLDCVIGKPAELVNTSRVYPAREASATQLGGTISSRLVRQMLLYSALALVVLILLAFGLGWWLAGRALAPVHQMAAAARRLSSANLHQRLPLHQPRDELRDLGESFNALLDRLAAAFASQQRFVANAAHELRTPLAIQRATIQIGLGEHPIDATELVSVREELLAANRRHERLIDGLLLLARGEGGLDQLNRVDLAEVVRDALPPLHAEGQAATVRLTVDTEPVIVDGDAVLLGQLLTNLVQNAIRYNRPDGRVAGTGITVTNTGPVIPAEVIDDLFEPFRRLHPDRTGSASGAGLGLSIVRSIATAHGGTVTARPNATGGLTVRVRLPARVDRSTFVPGQV